MKIEVIITDVFKVSVSIATSSEVSVPPNEDLECEKSDDLFREDFQAMAQDLTRAATQVIQKAAVRIQARSCDLLREEIGKATSNVKWPSYLMENFPSRRRIKI